MIRRTPCLAVVMCCLDYRYLESVQTFVKRRFAVKAYDLKTDAGGVKALLDGDVQVREWILENLRLACERHGVRTAILVNHQDCAAYGGSGAFKSRRAEAAFHARQLARARLLLKISFQRLSVRMFYARRTAGRIVLSEVDGRDRAPMGKGLHRGR